MCSVVDRWYLSVVVNNRHAGSIKSHGSVEGAVVVGLKFGNYNLMVVSMHAPHIWCGSCLTAIYIFMTTLMVSKFVESLSNGSKTKIIVGICANMKFVGDIGNLICEFAYSIGGLFTNNGKRNMYLGRYALMMNICTQFNLIALNTFSSKHIQSLTHSDIL